MYSCFDFDSLSVSILIRVDYGKRETFNFKNREEAYLYCADDEHAEMFEEIEILMVTIGNILIFNGLTSKNNITLTELCGFFA